jgi:hypothetical protein
VCPRFLHDFFLGWEQGGREVKGHRLQFSHCICTHTVRVWPNSWYSLIVLTILNILDIVNMVSLYNSLCSSLNSEPPHCSCVGAVYTIHTV